MNADERVEGRSGFRDRQRTPGELLDGSDGQTREELHRQKGSAKGHGPRDFCNHVDSPLRHSPKRLQQLLRDLSCGTLFFFRRGGRDPLATTIHVGHKEKTNWIG